MLAVGDQVEVVGELYGAGQFLQDVYAETFTAQLCVWLSVAYDTERERERKKRSLYRRAHDVLVPTDG